MAKYTEVSHYNREVRFGPMRHYGFLSFMGDVFMVIITSGLWLIWIFVREMRRI